MKNLKGSLLLLFAVLALLLCFAVPAADAQLGNVTRLFYPGAPTGACSQTQEAVNTSTGAFYVCGPGSNWLLSSVSPAILPFYPENYAGAQPGTLYPQILTGTCVFAAATTCTVNYPTTFASTPIVNITPVNPGAVTFTVTTSSTSQIIITASASNSLTVNYSAALPSGVNCVAFSFTLTGARQNLDFVVPLWPSALPANLIGTMRVSASDIIEVRLCNPTSATVTFSAALTYGAKLLR
jgi:hypothetical protein